MTVRHTRVEEGLQVCGFGAQTSGELQRPNLVSVHWIYRTSCPDFRAPSRLPTTRLQRRVAMGDKAQTERLTQ